MENEGGGGIEKKQQHPLADSKVRYSTEQYVVRSNHRLIPLLLALLVRPFSVFVFSSKLLFPALLYEVLEDVEKRNEEDIISWLPHGRSFRIHKIDRFEEKIIPRYFNHTSYKSFRRQLTNYDFRRVGSGEDEGAYFNPSFIRGQQARIKDIFRTKNIGIKYSQSIFDQIYYSCLLTEQQSVVSPHYSFLTRPNQNLATNETTANPSYANDSEKNPAQQDINLMQNSRASMMNPQQRDVSSQHATSDGLYPHFAPNEAAAYQCFHQTPQQPWINPDDAPTNTNHNLVYPQQATTESLPFHSSHGIAASPNPCSLPPATFLNPSPAAIEVAATPSYNRFPQAAFLNTFQAQQELLTSPNPNNASQPTGLKKAFEVSQVTRGNGNHASRSSSLDPFHAQQGTVVNHNPHHTSIATVRNPFQASQGPSHHESQSTVMNPFQASQRDVMNASNPDQAVLLLPPQPLQGLSNPKSNHALQGTFSDSIHIPSEAFQFDRSFETLQDKDNEDQASEETNQKFAAIKGKKF